MELHLQTFGVGGTNSFMVLLTCNVSFSWKKKSSHQCFLYSSNNGPSLTKSNLTKIKTELTTPPRDWDICRIGTKDKITQKCQLLGVEDPYLRRNWLPITTFAAVINLYIRNAGERLTTIELDGGGRRKHGQSVSIDTHRHSALVDQVHCRDQRDQQNSSQK